MEDYLRECGGGYQTLGAFVEHAREFGQAFLDKEPWQKIEQKILLIKDPAIQHELNLIMQKAKEKSASLKELSLADILTFAYPGHMSDFIQNTKPKVEKGTAEQLEKASITSVSNYRTICRISYRCFRRFFPTERYSPATKRRIKKLRMNFSCSGCPCNRRCASRSMTG